MVRGICGHCNTEGPLNPTSITFNNKGLCGNCFPSYNQQYCELCDSQETVLTYEKHLKEKHADELARFIATKAKEEKDIEYGLRDLPEPS